MPNYCNNTISIKAPRETLNTIQSLVKSDESEFDFNKIIPMPDYIYRGNLGPEEQKIYGKNNWYDWSNENWGTKWNCWDVEYGETEDELFYNFYTAWSPSEPVVKALAEMFPEANIRFRYEETGCCFCGEQEYENGHMVYCVNGDYYEHWFFDDEDEKEKLGITYSIEDEKDFGPATIYSFTYRDNDGERSILIEGFCCDARAERKEFSW